MHFSDSRDRVGHYLVTPLVKDDGAGGFLASVSLRRGAQDRVYRFAQAFTSAARAQRYAIRQGRQLALAP